ncbi:MAG: hypothetical protein GF331_06960 [Chitinivibrionales bacterium]|nr:hypothetical protein [Chitinivibrionales bacterium]
MKTQLTTHRGAVDGRRVFGLLLTCCLAVGVLLCIAGPSTAAPLRVVYLPFEDKVKLDEAWDLSVDIPRWFSQTVDTIGGARDSAVVSIPFDSTMQLLERNGWARREYIQPATVRRIAAVFEAAYVVIGTIETFKVVKRSLSGDGALRGTHGVSSYAVGGANIPMTAALQSFSADVRIMVEVRDGGSGQQVQVLPLSVDEKDGGLRIWLPSATENPEMDFYYMSRSPFGSEHFHRNVLGAVMKSCSHTVRQALVARETAAVAPMPVERELLEGTILDREGGDIYIDLGSDDNILLGERFEVLKPDRPVVGDGGDTLGWVEVPVGIIRIRAIRSKHFALASVVEESDSLRTGWTVRAQIHAAEQPRQTP